MNKKSFYSCSSLDRNNMHEFAVNVVTASHNNTTPRDIFIFVTPIKATENNMETLKIIFSLWEVDSKTLWHILQDLNRAVLALYLDTCMGVIPLSLTNIPLHCLSL